MTTPRPTTLAHCAVECALQAGELPLGVLSVAIDATMGNGHDTLFLARQMQELGGVVHAFDVQADALAVTRQRLLDAGTDMEFVFMHRGNHDTMDSVLHAWGAGQDYAVRAIMFNLGYLPGGDSGLITQPSSTVRALVAATCLLAVGGVITVVCYTGHEGGLEESQSVVQFAESLPTPAWRVLISKPHTPTSPFLVVIARE